MHALWLSAFLLSQAPTNSDQTETIGLAFISAAEVEEAFQERTSVVKNAPPLCLVPAGVQAWSIDVRSNTVTVTGEPSGIKAFKNIVRLLDVSPRHLSIEVRFIPLKEPAKPEGALYSSLGDEEAAALAERSSSRAWRLPTSNNRPVHFQAPMLGPGEPEIGQGITPRINSDGTITVIVTAKIRTVSHVEKVGQAPRDDLNVTVGSPVQVGPSFSVVIGMRRVASGQPTAIALPRQGVALWIRPTLLPDGESPAPAR